MGAFIVSFHAKTEDAAPVREVLAEEAERAWIAPPVNGWVSFYEERADMQDSDRIEELCGRVSEATGGAVIAFLVHDSDFVCYSLFENGRERDEYNSCPDYFGDASEMAGPGESGEEYLARVRGDADALLPLCPAGTSRDAVEALLQVGRGEYVFAEEHLDKLARLLGIAPERAASTYRDIGLEFSPDESGLEFVGRGTPPEPGEDSWGRLAGAAGDIGAAPLGVFAPGAGAGGVPSLGDMLAFAQNPNQKLMLAIAAKNAAAVEEAIAAGADVNASNGAVLMAAVASGSEELVRLLLAKGAEPAKSPAALMAAVTTGNEALLTLLLERGGDVRQVLPGGWSLLHFAVQSRNPAVVRRLLDEGADPSAKNSQGQTAAELAETLIRQMEAAAAAVAAMGQPFAYGEQMLPGLRAVRDVLAGGSAGSGDVE